MNEREKMIRGYLYNAEVPELIEPRMKAKDLCHHYNQLMPSNTAERKSILKKLLGRTGENFHIEQPFYVDYGFNITLGENFYSNHFLTILDPAPVIIGDNCMIGPNCGLYSASHPLDAETRTSMLEFASPITIGNNVWLGGSVVVLPGVSIGDNTVIAAGSVVSKDIPANVVAAGVPCRVLREITPDDKKKNNHYSNM